MGGRGKRGPSAPRMYGCSVVGAGGGLAPEGQGRRHSAGRSVGGKGVGVGRGASGGANLEPIWSQSGANLKGPGVYLVHLLTRGAHCAGSQTRAPAASAAMRDAARCSASTMTAGHAACHEP